jgi:hypothetical protein
MVSLQPVNWGTLGSRIPECLLENILRSVPYESVRGVNRNGRVLANAWQVKDRDDRAKAVEGSTEGWSGYYRICELLKQDHQHEVTCVQAKCDVVVAMIRAAFGRNVIGGAIPDITFQLIEYKSDVVLVLPGTIVLLKVVQVEGGCPVEVLRIKPVYGFRGTLLRPSELNQAFANVDEGRVAAHIVDLFYLYAQDVCGWDTSVMDIDEFSTSFKNILSPECITPVSRIDSGTVNLAYFQSTHEYVGCIQITAKTIFPKLQDAFYAVLWRNGPRFCVVNDGTYAFRTPRFPIRERVPWRPVPFYQNMNKDKPHYISVVTDVFGNPVA